MSKTNHTTNNYKRYFQAFIIIFGAGAIYPLLYLRQNFETAILNIFHITGVELSHYYSILGVMFMLGYLPSGWLADKFSPKLLLSFSLFLTGLLGIVFAQIPDKSYLIYIFCGWGFATGFTFWGALMKSIKMLAHKDEQGRFFGFLDGGRGLVEAGLATIAASILSNIAGEKNATFDQTKTALITIIYMYSLICIALSILTMIFLKSGTQIDDENIKTNNPSKSNLINDLKALLSIKEVWFVATIIFCGYQLFYATYSFSKYLQVHYNILPVTAAFITVAKLWMRPIGGIGGGFLGDKFGNTAVLATSMFGAAIGLLMMTYMPSGVDTYILLIVVLLLGIMTYTIRALYWSTLDGCNIPVNIIGLGIGIISVIGYLPDVFVPEINGYFLKNFKEETAFQYFFTYISIIGVIGGCITILLHYRIKNKAIKA